MAEKLFDAQVNYGWGLSLNMTGKAPAVAKRIFDTYADALAYANDVNDSAIDGLVLSVVADTTASLNGVYFVQQAATKAIEADEEKGIEAVDAKPAILAKLSSAQDNQNSAESVLQELNNYKTSNNAIVSGHTAALAILNGGADVEGSVAKAVADEKALREAAEKAITDRLDVIEGEAEGSVKKALADAKTYADNKVTALDAEVSSTDGAHVTVKVTEVDGVITAVNVTESDIASAQGLADEVAARQAAISGISEVIGEVAEGKSVVDMINDAQNAAAAAATKIADKATGHVTVSVAQDEQTGALTYTIAENDIASAQALAEVESGKTVTLNAAEQAEAGYLKTYVLAQGGVEVGKINIPKDLVVTKGEIVVKDNEKYLRLTIANQDAPVDIAVKDLVDVYTGSDYITVGDDNKISVKFDDLDAALVAEGTEVQKAIAAEASAREAAISGVSKEVADEKAAREAAISGVSKEVADEKARAEGEEGKLSQAIADEKARAEEEEGKLTTAIANEVTAREAAVKGLSEMVSDEFDAINEQLSGLTQDIADEAAAREAAISGVSKEVADEAAAREAAISGVSKEVADEKAAREAAIKAMKLEEVSGFIVKIKQENGIVSAQAAETAPANKIAVADVENKFTGTDVEAVLAELDGKINNVSSAAIGVEAGNGIDITPNGTLQKIAVKLSSEAGNALTIDAKGLYLSNIIDCGTF